MILGNLAFFLFGKLIPDFDQLVFFYRFIFLGWNGYNSFEFFLRFSFQQVAEIKRCARFFTFISCFGDGLFNNFGNQVNGFYGLRGNRGRV